MGPMLRTCLAPKACQANPAANKGCQSQACCQQELAKQILPATRACLTNPAANQGLPTRAFGEHFT